jgi:hypothetical protein
VDHEQESHRSFEQADESALERLEEVIRSSKLSSSFGAAATPRFKLVREIKPVASEPFVRPLVLAIDFEGGFLVIDMPDSGRFRVRRLMSAEAGWETIANLPKGTADNEILEPTSIALDSEHNSYILDAVAGVLKKFSYDGRWLDSFFAAGSDGAPFANPRDFAIDRSGGLYIADTENDRIVKLRPNGESEWIAEEFPAPDGDGEPDGFYEPASVSVASDGEIFVADTNHNRSLCLDRQGRFLRVIAGEGTLEFPSRIRLGGTDESVYVVDQGGIRVSRFDRTGRSTGCLRIAGLGLEPIGPEGSAGFAVDPAGHVALVNAVRESITLLDFLEV